MFLYKEEIEVDQSKGEDEQTDEVKSNEKLRKDARKLELM